jgi:hypothetical protein
MSISKTFLEYTWHVMRDTHSVSGHCIDGSDRWPGYIGSDYRPGGIAFIGTIHNPKEVYPSKSATAAAGMRRLKASLQTWAQQPLQTALCDLTILPQLRANYLDAIKFWVQTPVWGMFDSLRRIAMQEWKDIAFTNIAKCAGPTTYTLPCAKTFQLNDFVTILDPGYVLICNDDRLVRCQTQLACEVSARCFVLRFPNSTRPYPGKLSWAAAKASFKGRLKSDGRPYDPTVS